MTIEEEMSGWTTKALKGVIATINPNGLYGPWVAAAKRVLEKRGVSYADCMAGVNEVGSTQVHA